MPKNYKEFSGQNFSVVKSGPELADLTQRSRIFFLKAVLKILISTVLPEILGWTQLENIFNKQILRVISIK